jgi:hypothetical protein
MERLALAALVAAASCKKDPGPPSAAPAPSPGSEKKPGPDTYAVSLKAQGPYSAGKPASVSFSVAAKAGYHVNPEYPMVFKPQGHQGVVFAEERVKLAWGATTPCPGRPDEACEVELPIAVTPEKAGPAVVAGLVAFSVCNPQHCQIEKLPVSVSIDVQ